MHRFWTLRQLTLGFVVWAVPFVVQHSLKRRLALYVCLFLTQVQTAVTLRCARGQVLCLGLWRASGGL
jgi:hypothetical protein